MLRIQGEKKNVPVFGTDIRHDVLVEELEDEWDTVGKHQVLGDNLELQGKKREALKKSSFLSWNQNTLIQNKGFMSYTIL